MISTLLSFDRRALRRASLALAGVATITACDNDRTVGPNAANAPVAPATAVLPMFKTGGLLISILDQNNALPSTPGAQFSVGKSGSKTFIVTDNAPGDKHPAAGGILVQGLLPGAYTVCQTAAPAGYVLPTPPACQPIEVLPGTNDLGNAAHVLFAIIKAPRATWVAYDPLNGDTVPSFSFTGNNGSGPLIIADNAPMDLDPRPGVFEVAVLTGSSYSVCPHAAPSGYAFPLPSQGCVTKPVTAGQTTSIGNMFVRHQYSAYWYVSLGGKPSKGAQFKITHATTNTTVNVVDDGQNDMASPSMMVYVKLAAAGWYSVCMTVAPDGGAMADPPCRRIEVLFAEPAYGGDFVSTPILW